MLDLDQFVIRDFVLADDAMGGRTQLPGINRNGEAHGLVGIVPQIGILIA